jgi:hypothetical protein
MQIARDVGEYQQLQFNHLLKSVRFHCPGVPGAIPRSAQRIPQRLQILAVPSSRLELLE